MSPDKARRREVPDPQKVLEEARDKLRYHLQAIQEDLTVSTTQAAEKVGTTAAKLRRWDKDKLLSSEHRSSRDESSSQRRYNRRELARALMIQELLQTLPNYQAVLTFMRQNKPLIDAYVNDLTTSGTYQEQPRKVLELLTWAEDAAFWRMFVQRAIYLCIRLLYEQTPDRDAWLLLPLTQEGLQRAERGIQSVEQLAEMGEVLLGYCNSKHPFFIGILNSVLDLPKHYKIISPAWPLTDTSKPAGVHLVLAERPRKKSSASSLKDAALLLRLLQETQAQWKPYLQEGNDAMTYYSPEFEKALPGQQLLNKIADLIIQLGGIDQASQRPRWHFCCILTAPSHEILRSLKQRRLVVQGISSACPYDIGKKELSPDENSMSMLAYHNKQIIYRHNIVDEEPDIASHEQEQDIRSAMPCRLRVWKKTGAPSIH